MDVIVTTAGGIEEDLIKCLAHTYLGDFSLSGKELRQRGINRSTKLYFRINSVGESNIILRYMWLFCPFFLGLEIC